MNLSLDTYLSGKLGIDNNLCPPLHSISWWGLVAIHLFVWAEAWRHFSTRGSDAIVLASLATVLLVFYFILRRHVLRMVTLIAQPAISEKQTSALRSISFTGLQITGVAMLACLFGIMRI